jgi:hypothetical protein
MRSWIDQIRVTCHKGTCHLIKITARDIKNPVTTLKMPCVPMWSPRLYCAS